MKIRIIVLAILLSFQTISEAQYSLSTGDKVLQFSGYIVPFFNYRFYDANIADYSKNRFNMDYAVFRADGMSGNHIHYEIQLNFPAIYSSDVSDELLMQSTIEWRTRKDNFNIQFGYDKLPFSRASMTSLNKSIWMQRPEVVRSKTLNRRDAGITIEKNFFNKRLNFYGGVYTGQGIESIVGDNDKNGKYLYVGRVEASFPAKPIDGDVDMNHVRIPNVSLGYSMMYTEKTVTTGTDYPLLTVDGKKRSQSIDGSIFYKGLVLSAEYIVYRVEPNDITFLYGKPTHYYLASGYYLNACYNIRKLKSTVAVRYDSFDPSDLLEGNARGTISYGYVYHLDGMNSCIKIQYFKRLQDGSYPVWSEDQLRVGWLFKF